MAVKDGPGLRPVAQSAKRHFLKLARSLDLDFACQLNQTRLLLSELPRN